MTTYGWSRWVDANEVAAPQPNWLCTGRLILGTSQLRQGSCVRIHKNWILTAHHVVDIPDIARRFTVRFNNVLDAQSVFDYRLDPYLGYFSSRDGILSPSCVDLDLDYVFIGLAGPYPLEDPSGTYLARVKLESPQPGARLQIPQFMGLPKRLKFPVELPSAPASVGRVTLCEGSNLYHQVSTVPGASGAPIFDEQWNMVALHTGGRVDQPGTGVAYQNNEGTLMQAIVADARARHPAFPIDEVLNIV